MPTTTDTEPRTDREPLPAWEDTPAEAGRADRDYWTDHYDD